MTFKLATFKLSDTVFLYRAYDLVDCASNNKSYKKYCGILRYNDANRF